MCHREVVAILGAALLALLLRGVQRPQPVVPLRFKHINDQAVVRGRLHETSPRQIRLLPGPLHVLVAQGVGLVEAGLELGLHLKRHVQGHRRDHLDQQLADRLIESGPRDRLALVRRRVDGLPLADVIGPLGALAGVIPHGHALAAHATEHQPLE